MTDNKSDQKQTKDVQGPEESRFAPEKDQNLKAKKPLHKRILFRVVFAVMILGGIVGGTAYWLHVRQYEDTDDAFVDGEIVQISAKVSGIIQNVDVQDNQDVAAGTVLVRIDPRDLQAILNEAKASLEAAQAKLDVAKTNVDLTGANTEATLAEAQAGGEQANAAIESSKSQLASAQADVLAAEAESVHRQADLKRYKSLDQRAVSQQQLDAAQAAADAAEANLTAVRKRVSTAEASVTEAQAKGAHALGVLAAAKTGPQQVAVAQAQVKNAQAAVDEAKAVVDAAELNLSYTTIRAPISGRVTRRTAREGQYVQVGQIAMALVRSDVWVTANFKETQIAHMYQGQDVDIEVDVYPGRIFHGRVDSIQAGTGARFSMLPPENATGNFVKVVQRMPVKILFDPDAAHQWLLAPGMSVIPKVRVGSGDLQRPLPIVPPAVRGTASTNPAVPSAGETLY